MMGGGYPSELGCGISFPIRTYMVPVRECRERLPISVFRHLKSHCGFSLAGLFFVEVVLSFCTWKSTKQFLKSKLLGEIFTFF